MEPAEEIGILIGAPAIETPLIAAAMQHCLAYGLISTGEGDTGKIINFSLTEAYTRAWTRDAIERREKREAEKLEAKAPQIEEKAEAEADSPKEKEDPIDYTAIKDAWNKMAKPAGLDEVLRITDKRREHIRARVREYSFDQCLRAIELVGESPFLCGKVPPKDGQKPFKADLIWVFKNSDNFTKLLEGKYKDRTQDVQPAQAQPKTQPVTEETVRDTIMREGIWNIRTQAWDRAKLDKIRDKIGPEMAAAIAKPLESIDKVTIIDGGHGGSGVDSMGAYVPSVLARTIETMKEVTGLDLVDIMKAETYDAKVNRNITVSPDAAEAVKAALD
jgi:hypothetical protein